jgi:tetratricopeptide (TPR) repeat protein
LNNKFTKKVTTLSAITASLVVPSFVSSAGTSETFIAKINGVTKLSKTIGYYYAKVKIENGILKDIKEIPQNELKNYKEILKSNSKNEIELFYPSDYKIQITQNEKKSAKKNKLAREQNWDKILKHIKAQNVVANDNDLENLTEKKKEKEIKRREALWEKVSKRYLVGDYYGVLNEVKPLYKLPSHQGMAYLISGMSAKKFQDSPLAEKHFKNAVKYKVKTKDVFFQLGKVLFTQNKLDEAFENFQKSFKYNTRIYRSKYFLGWIEENRKNYNQAKAHYEEALELTGIDIETKQAIIIRLAKVNEAIAKKNPISRLVNLFVTRDVATPLKKSLQENSETRNASTIERILERIQSEYRIPSIIPFKIGSMGYYLRYNQNFQYDTNASAENEELSDFRDSLVSKSQFLYKHLFSTKKGFIHTPELRINHQYNFEKNIPNIATNSQYTISPAFRNSFSHNWFGQKTNLTFDIETSYTKRNLDSDGEYKYFNKSIKYNVGDFYKFFDFGRTIFKFRYDTRSFFDSSLDSTTTTLFVNQFINTSKKHTISLIANMDMTSVEDSSNDANSYMLRADYIAPSLFYKGDFQAGLTILATDTLAQSSTRGTELMISPEVEWRRTFNKYFEIALQYYYTNNQSKLDALSYDQHILSFEIELNQN